jgi:hypothetical protein
MKAFLKIEIVPAAVILAVTALHIFLVPVSPYWLDSPEFTASAFSLSLSHPPGHPLYETAGKLFALLPAGSVAFRMNFFSTACCALALVFTVLLGARIMTAGFSVGKNTAVLMATLAILPVGLSPGWMHQATHAEVYGFEVMLLAAMLWLASHYLVAPRRKKKTSRTGRGTTASGGSSPRSSSSRCRSPFTPSSPLSCSRRWRRRSAPPPSWTGGPRPDGGCCCSPLLFARACSSTCSSS